MQVSNSMRPIVELEDKINTLSRAMAPYLCVPGGYVGPPELQEQLNGAYAELRRVRGY